jgi:Flp pilus assembly pilin Flp
MLRCTRGNAVRSEPKGQPKAYQGPAARTFRAIGRPRQYESAVRRRPYCEYAENDGWVTRSGCLGHRTYPRRDERQPSLEKGGIVFLVLRREEGQGLAEYGLIGSLIAVLAVLALVFMSGNLNHLLSIVGQKL